MGLIMEGIEKSVPTKIQVSIVEIFSIFYLGEKCRAGVWKVQRKKREIALS